MACSTAARTGMKIVRSSSFPTSLQFMCCQVLRQCIPADKDVTKALRIAPGLKLFLVNNLDWLLRPYSPEEVNQAVCRLRKRAKCVHEMVEKDKESTGRRKRGNLESSIPARRKRHRIDRATSCTDLHQASTSHSLL